MWGQVRTCGDRGTAKCAYLQAASGTVLGDDADVRRVDARPDEPGQVFILDVSHLNRNTSGSVRFWRSNRTRTAIREHLQMIWTDSRV